MKKQKYHLSNLMTATFKPSLKGQHYLNKTTQES